MLAILQTCRKLCLAECRAFWLYANIDMDLLPCALGRPSIDYRTLSTPLLRSRVMKAWSIHAAWRENLLEPKRVRFIPVEHEIRRFVCIPWTRAVVLLVDNNLFLEDWSSAVRVPVPLSQGATLSTVSMRVFWTDPENGWVLVVHCLGTIEFGEATTHLQLFAVDPVLISVSFLTSVVIPHSVSGIDLRGDHLAVVGHTAHLRSSAVIRIKAPTTFGETSFAIVDVKRFVLVGPRGLAIYRLSAAALHSPGVCIPWLRPVWTHFYSEPDILSHPPLGPILIRTGGATSFSISGGAYLRCVLKTPGKADDYAVLQKRLAEKVPLYFGFSTGSSIGVYRRPLSAPSFTTFSRKESMHPFFYEGDHRASAKGSVIFQFDVMDSLEVGALQVDEEQGRIMFLVRSHAKPVAKIIILELV
ncbi:hypothetical protein C8R47DRAFT_1209148 [Mycena vitilis]|nr:hypothetical protein C8R47DRAFT_1209148 [Mycena vitilis]